MSSMPLQHLFSARPPQNSLQQNSLQNSLHNSLHNSFHSFFSFGIRQAEPNPLEQKQQEEELKRILEVSFSELPIVSRSQTNRIEKSVSLKEERVEQETDATCIICLEKFLVGSTCMLFPCCSTVESKKAMHVKCTVNYLRTSEQCPHCKSARINLQ